MLSLLDNCVELPPAATTAPPTESDIADLQKVIQSPIQLIDNDDEKDTVSIETLNKLGNYFCFYLLQ